MEWLADISQVVVALGIINVWVLRFGRPTRWRGGSARSMREEFEVYGLPEWTLLAVGGLKLLLAGLLLVGLWLPSLARPAAIGLAVVMLGAVAMHLNVRDPLRKSLPALSVLALCVLVSIWA